MRAVVAADAAAITHIYNHYVQGGHETFETAPVEDDDMAARIIESVSHQLPWLVAEQDGVVLGYACASRWKGRCAYRHSAETSVYLATGATGRGLGGALYRELIVQLRGQSMHSLIGGIALPNETSVALHERLGFRKVAHFAEVGYKFDRWIDVGYWQLLL